MYRILVSSLLLTIPVTASSKFDWKSIKYVYAFGDSYTFVGGTAGHANYSFIGDMLDLAFTPEELLSNEIILRNTSSEGANWPEFLTGCFEGLPSDCPVQLWDFAFAGANIDQALLPLHHDYTVPLVDQVRQWKDYASDFIPRPFNETLTAWFIGINDCGDTVGNSSITNYTEFLELEMNSYFGAVELAFENGLNGAHLFINVPPGERAPYSLGNSTKAELHKSNVLQYNSMLAQYVENFASGHPETKVVHFDTYGFYNKILDSPEKYGFKNITGFCQCDDPGYFWYNSGHPTERVHKLMAEEIGKELVSASSSL